MRKLILATFLWAVFFAVMGYELSLMRYGPCVMCQASYPDPYQKLYEEVLAPVVKVRANGATGSGVLLSSLNVVPSGLRVNGLMSSTYVLTAAHVVGNESKVQVIYYSYHEDTKAPSCLASCLSAFVVVTDTNKDLALLRCESGVRRYACARLAPRNYKPYLFTPVYAVGCSLGFNPRPSEGIITSIGYRGTSIEISAPILPGNSGGGVFLKETRPNDRGHSAGQAHELIGIVVWVRTYHGQLVTTMCGIVPINEIYDFLEEAGIGRRFTQIKADKFVSQWVFIPCEVSKGKGPSRREQGSLLALPNERG